MVANQWGGGRIVLEVGTGSSVVLQLNSGGWSSCLLSVTVRRRQIAVTMSPTDGGGWQSQTSQRGRNTIVTSTGY